MHVNYESPSSYDSKVVAKVNVFKMYVTGEGVRVPNFVRFERYFLK